jgi:uncharacterized membrane protein (UPF0127 family)
MSIGVPLPRIAVGQRLRVVNQTRATVLVEELTLALGPWTRLRGLLGRPALRPDQGLLLRPCRAVHTCFMRYAIDALFLDETGAIVELALGLRPWRLSPVVGGALATLELRAGAAASTATARGDQLRFVAV